MQLSLPSKLNALLASQSFTSSIVVLGIEPKTCVSQTSTLLSGTEDHQTPNFL